MRRRLGMVGAALAAAAAVPAGAQAQAQGSGEGRALGGDLTWITDADDTEVVRAGANFDLAYHGPDDYRGVRLERAWFNPMGRGWTGDDRIYLRAADTVGRWTLKAAVGTDGHTVLGSASAHDDSRFRKEVFVEREILETPRGIAERVHHTFAGAAIDLPADERNVATLLAGVQTFGGENRRLHLRANFVHVLKPEWGLSAQLRTRWFRNSVPRELDYYSPRWYAQALPVLQLRRTTDSGWRLLAAGGLGVQRDSESGWRRASYLNLQATSPRVGEGWALTGAVTFAETPTTGGAGYHFLQVSTGAVFAF